MGVHVPVQDLGGWDEVEMLQVMDGHDNGRMMLTGSFPRSTGYNTMVTNGDLTVIDVF